MRQLSGFAIGLLLLGSVLITADWTVGYVGALVSEPGRYWGFGSLNLLAASVLAFAALTLEYLPVEQFPRRLMRFTVAAIIMPVVLFGLILFGVY